MNGKKRLFSNRNIIILSSVLFAILITISVVGILFVWCLGPVLIIGHGVVGSFQDELRQGRLLCRTDHQALLAECRQLHRQLSAENPDIKRQEYIKVSDSELSKFPLIRRLGGRVFASLNGAVWIELGTTWRHFGVSAATDDLLSRSSPGGSFGNRELVPGLWYYDDAYNRNKNYDQTIDHLLKRRRK
jgi:hypothetical protein